jgi:hypothetical protein
MVAILGKVFDSVVRFAERTIPGVQSFLSWESIDLDIGCVSQVRVVVVGFLKEITTVKSSRILSGNDELAHRIVSRQRYKRRRHCRPKLVSKPSRRQLQHECV